MKSLDNRVGCCIFRRESHERAANKEKCNLCNRRIENRSFSGRERRKALTMEYYCGCFRKLKPGALGQFGRKCILITCVAMPRALNMQFITHEELFVWCNQKMFVSLGLSSNAPRIRYTKIG